VSFVTVSAVSRAVPNRARLERLEGGTTHFAKAVFEKRLVVSKSCLNVGTLVDRIMSA
jgi:hypothetical protein